MLKINNIKFKKYRTPLVLIAISLGGIFLFQYLTFIPEYSHAESISTPTYKEKHPNLSDITYMQDITPEICTNTLEADTEGNYQYQLEDSRDHKKYWVAKLADGNCWMTQNLDFDLKAGEALTSTKTDVSDWTPKNNEGTIAADAISSSNWGYDINGVYSYDPGKVVYIGGGTDSCQSDNIQDCAEWINVEGKQESNEPTFGMGIIGDIYNAHYVIGNYYSYGAATANTGASINTNNVSTEESICPKGWQLPYSGRNNFVASGSAALDIANNIPIVQNKSFVNLLNAYEWNKWTGRDEWGNPYTALGNSPNSISGAPLYFLYGGYISVGALQGVNTDANYWSSTAASLSDAYRFNLNQYSIYPANYWYRHLGFSVRCVNRGENPIIEPEIENPNISVSVPNMITLSIDSEVVDIDTSVSNPAEGNFTTTVTSNSKYNLALSATAPEGQTPHTDLKNEDPNKTTSIPALSSTNPIVTEADESWWGIKCTNPTDSTNCTKTAYTGLTLNPDTYFTSTTSTPTTGTETPFTIGIKVSPNLPSGTYSTSIQVTASSTGSN